MTTYNKDGWQRGGKQEVLRVYERLHQNKIGSHWIWCALTQIANGEPEERVLSDFGYVYNPAALRVGDTAEWGKTE